MAKKTTFNNPDSQEREYVRLLLRLSKALARNIEEFVIPRIAGIKAEYDIQRKVDAWTDTLEGAMSQVNAASVKEVQAVIERLPGQFQATNKYNEAQFRMVVKANTGFDLPPVMPGAPSATTLGVSVFRNEPFLAPLAQGWVSENTSLIKSIPTKLNPEIEGIIRRGVMEGASVKDLKSQIREKYGATDYRATLIAQDQTLKLNADLTEHRLQSVGVKQYTWKTVHDSRVRPAHVERDGKVFAWDKPPSGGKNPGMEVRCRCRAEAIWKEEEITPAQKVEPTQPTGSKKDLIWSAAEKAWGDLGKPTGAAELLQLRKQVMRELEIQNPMPRVTLANTLLRWEKDLLARLNGAQPLKPLAVRAPVAPVAPKPATGPLTPAPGAPLYRNANAKVKEWQDASFSGAPAGLKRLLYKLNMDPTITFNAQEGAYCRYKGETINMGTHKSTTMSGRSTWRHELGHLMDSKVGKNGDFFSHSAEFRAAMKKDSAALVVSDKAQVPKISLEFSRLTTPADRHDFIEKQFAKIGIEYDEIRKLTEAVSALPGFYSEAKMQFVYMEMFYALEGRSAQVFLDAMTEGYVHRRASQELGGLDIFSDLIGSITKNAVCGYNRGGFGHSDAYYASLAGRAGHETMANMTSLYGSKEYKAWSQILPRFIPEVDKRYRTLLV